MEIINVYDEPDCWVCHPELILTKVFPGMGYPVCQWHLGHHIALTELPDFGGCWRE